MTKRKPIPLASSLTSEEIHEIDSCFPLRSAIANMRPLIDRAMDANTVDRAANYLVAIKTMIDELEEDGWL